MNKADFLLLDFPVPAGFHLLTVPGQKDKVLTPVSDEIRFEISQAKGGKITVLTDADAKQAHPNQPKMVSKDWFYKNIAFFALSLLAVLLLAAAGIIFFIRTKNNKNLLSIFKK